MPSKVVIRKTKFMKKIPKEYQINNVTCCIFLHYPSMEIFTMQCRILPIMIIWCFEWLFFFQCLLIINFFLIQGLNGCFNFVIMYHGKKSLRLLLLSPWIIVLCCLRKQCRQIARSSIVGLLAESKIWIVHP